MSGRPRTRISARRTVVAVTLTVGLVLAVAATAWGSDPRPGTPAAAHQADHAALPYGDRIDPVVFHQDMRKLWEDHVTWTRLFIVSAVAGLDDADETAGRLLQNQADFGAAVASFYGDEAGDALTALLEDHILIAADLLTAAKTGDTAGVEAETTRWYANADEISAFLAGANPAWPEDALAEMMRGHLDQTLREAVARLQGDWAADIAAYDEIHLHILHMADTLADGIVEQFPHRFTH